MSIFLPGREQGLVAVLRHLLSAVVSPGQRVQMCPETAQI